MNTTAIDLADYSFRNISQDSDWSIPAIIYWYRASLGFINNSLRASYEINSTTFEFSPAMDQNVATLFDLFFRVHFLDVKTSDSLGAAALDPVLEVGDFGTVVRVQNRNELAKTWLQLRKETKLQLDQQIQAYLANQFSPIQVAGDDTIYSLNGGLINSITTNTIDTIV